MAQTVYHAVFDLIVDPDGIDHVIFRGAFEELDRAKAVPLPQPGQRFMGWECSMFIARNEVGFWLDALMDSAVFAFHVEGALGAKLTDEIGKALAKDDG